MTRFSSRSLVPGRIAWFLAVAGIFIASGLAPLRAATKLTPLHSFSVRSLAQGTDVNLDGISSNGGLVQSSDGNFYGMARSGGANGTGTIFKISSTGTFSTLHSFSSLSLSSSYGNGDGASPDAGLTEGNDGNFYGTARSGGTNGFGTIFKISSTGSFTTLYSFSAINHNSENGDGAYPEGGLVQDSDGNFYGTATYGGGDGTGTVFKITPTGTFTTLYTFSAATINTTPQDANSDGAFPAAALDEGSDGNLYGSTESGGSNGNGTVFKISPAGTLTTLVSFDISTSGAGLQAGLIQGSDGDFYGTSIYGGANGNGTVFKITSTGTFTLLYSFSKSNSNGVNSDGRLPSGSLVEGSDGNFYGAAEGGGTNGNGTLFTITPSGAFTTLYSFSLPSSTAPYGNSDGSGPVGSLALGSDGNFYGATHEGGANGTGTIFRLDAPRSFTSFTPASGTVGTTVTITGVNLGGTTVVGFTGQHAKTFTINNAGTQITTTVPMGAQTGSIALLTSDGIVIRSATNFTVTASPPAPTITGFSPASGPVGTVVTITGTNLTGTTTVGFMGRHAASFTVNAAGTQITATVPAGATTGPVAVLTNGVEAKSSASYTVTP